MGRNLCRSLRVVPFAVSLVFCVALASPIHAQDQTIAQMVHTSWTGKDGAPQSIDALAQTPDGMLWIGSRKGLFSFDGLRFTLFTPRSGPLLPSTSGIHSLMVSKQGDLWVFFFHGPPACIHDGGVRFYDRAEDGAITTLADAQTDSDGAMFAVLNWQHLARLGSDNVWHKVGNPNGRAGYIGGVFIDSSNTLWVVEDNLLYRKSKTDSAFAATDIHAYEFAKFAENRDRTFWLISVGTGPGATNLQHVDPAGRRLFTPRVKGQLSNVVVASDDSVWIQTDLGLRRLRRGEITPDSSDRSAGSPDSFGLRIGISALVRDTDGNIWVGGLGGLDRFEHANLVPAIVPSKINAWFTCVDGQGAVWVATGDGPLFTMKNGETTQVLNGGGAGNLACGSQGQAYLVRDSRILVVSPGHVLRLPLLPGFPEYNLHYMFLGLVEDPDRGLIATVGGNAGGLWRYAQGRWSRFLPDLHLPEVCAMLHDGQNGLYLAFTPPDARIGMVRKGSLVTQPVPIGSIGFARTSYGIVVYGMKGIAIKGNKDFQELSFIHPEHARIVTGVVEARGGDLWLMGASGVVRIPAAEVRAAMANPGHSISSVNFQEGDFVGPDRTVIFRHGADIDKGGRLWFSMINGVVSIDPDHLAEPRHPPRLSIRSIIADGREMDASATFPPDMHTLDIRYFGLDLSNPERVVYRYRLEGPDARDSSWQDVASRTEAVYSHLRPGSYKFQVMASNGNDIWTQPVCSATFKILPHFYERPGVQGLFLLAGVLLVWTAIALRLQYVSAAIRIRAEERADERVRIARELHDTLLQSFHGVMFQFQAARNLMTRHPDEAMRSLDDAIHETKMAIAESRDAIQGLRSEPIAKGNLAELLMSLSRELADSNPNNHLPVFDLIEEGERQTLSSTAGNEICRIGHELMRNAYQHAHAQRIEAEIRYDDSMFRLRIRDDGKGIEPQVLTEGGRMGHWGLRGVRERADRIRAHLDVWSEPGNGTEVQLLVPASIAYESLSDSYRAKLVRRVKSRAQRS